MSTTKMKRTAAWLLALLPAILILTACAGQDAPGIPSGEADPEAEYTLAFDIAVDTPPEAVTRATEGSGEGYEEGTEWENYIDVAGSDYRILFFSHHPDVSDADYYLGSLRDITLSLVADSPTRKVYNVNGKIHGEVARMLMANVSKIVVLANWHSYERLDEITVMLDPAAAAPVMPVDDEPGDTPREPTTLSQIWETAEFDFTTTLRSDGQSQYPLRSNNLIPLYGATNPYAGIRFDGNRYFHAGTIHLLRAYAKVEVVQAGGSVGIEDVRLRRYNTRGFSLPYFYRTQDDYLKGYYAGDYVHLTHIPAGNSVRNDGTISFNQSDFYTWYIYVPEYDNVGKGDSEQSAIEIKFENNDHYETLHFSRYVTASDTEVSRRGDDFDLRRNNLYRYTVYKDLRVQVDVIPYTGVELNPDFGFDDLLPRPPSEGEMPPWVEVDPE